MSNRVSPFSSTLGKKILMAITGLIAVGFLVGHLAGNLLLFLPDSEPYNLYSDKLLSFGWGLVAIELFLLAVFLGHAISGIMVTRTNRKARSEKYDRYASAGKPSRQSWASSTMIWTGVVLFVFTALHLKTFKYGAWYVTQIEGREVRDLYRLVVEVFQDPIYVLGYVAAMVFMGFHLRHGFWSAFQSLGVAHPRYTGLIYSVGYILAVALGLGFLAIPVWVYVQGGS